MKALEAQVTQLEAAVTQVLASTKPRHVHQLRTTVRRTEALLELLGALDGIPDHAAEANKVRRRLKKLRLAAGAVRDRDVQLDLVGGVSGEQAPRASRREARDLTRSLAKDREHETQQLVAVVKRQGEELVPEVERLLKVLAPAAAMGLSSARLTGVVREWATHRMASSDAKTPEDVDRLHGLRKTAKLARYIAEAAPDSSSGLRRLRDGYQALQQSGGTWHDWMTLSQIASRRLGKSSALTKKFAVHCETSLEKYEKALKASKLGPSW